MTMKKLLMGLNFYRIFAFILFLGLIFILALPGKYDLRSREKTEECIANMREVVAATEQYMRDRDYVFSGTVDDLTRTRYLKTANIICPEQGKYAISVDPETRKVTVTCFNVATHPSHTLETK